MGGLGAAVWFFHMSVFDSVLRHAFFSGHGRIVGLLPVSWCPASGAALFQGGILRPTLHRKYLDNRGSGYSTDCRSFHVPSNKYAEREQTKQGGMASPWQGD